MLGKYEKQILGNERIDSVLMKCGKMKVDLF
jgi:hypothetical protein